MITAPHLGQSVAFTGPDGTLHAAIVSKEPAPDSHERDLIVFRIDGLASNPYGAVPYSPHNEPMHWSWPPR